MSVKVNNFPMAKVKPRKAGQHDGEHEAVTSSRGRTRILFGLCFQAQVGNKIPVPYFAGIEGQDFVVQCRVRFEIFPKVDQNVLELTYTISAMIQNFWCCHPRWLVQAPRTF